jgi:amidase/aspartyl-tRNA(Asn)/glutamyl-tRNA(Gln) amidotransferase subunit A
MIMNLNVVTIEGFKAQGVDLMEGDNLPPVYREWIERSKDMGIRDVSADNIMRTKAFDALQGVFANHDMLATPTLSTMPPLNEGNGDTMGPREVNGVEIDPSIGFCLTYITNFTGHPSASLPAGLADGLPVGLQLIGPSLRDDLVLAASAAFERVRPWMDTYEVCRSRAI